VRRAIDIDAGTVALLAKHRRAQAELRMANRNTYRDHGLVFAKEWADVRGHFDSLGRPLQLDNLGQRECSRLTKAAGVKAIKFHGLRHTCATLLLSAGEPVHVVSERLGHASAMMTLNVYSHVVGNMQKRAASRVGGLLYGRG
jgi:integrase